MIYKMLEIEKKINIGDEVYYFDEYSNFIFKMKVEEIDGEVVKGEGINILKECCYKSLEEAVKAYKDY